MFECELPFAKSTVAPAFCKREKGRERKGDLRGQDFFSCQLGLSEGVSEGFQKPFQKGLQSAADIQVQFEAGCQVQFE